MSDVAKVAKVVESEENKKTSKQSKLTIWQITLIVFGSLVLLAILIGCGYLLYKYNTKSAYPVYYLNPYDGKMYHDPGFVHVLKHTPQETYDVQSYDGGVTTVYR